MRRVDREAEHTRAERRQPELPSEGMRTRVALVIAAFTAVIASPASADSVTDWWEVSNRSYLSGQTGFGPRSADAERASARTALAMFEAVNAIDQRYQSYLGVPAGDPTASQDAAAATAAYKILVRHYPAQKAGLDESYAMAMALIPDGAAKESGIAIGERAAEAAANVNGLDPASAQPPYRPRTVPGEWIGAALPTTESYWLALKPWAMGTADALRPPPPPPLDSDIYTRDYEEVRRLGSRTSTERTPEQTLIARYRQGYDLAPMVRYIADRPGRRRVDNARLLALYQMAFDDATQAMTEAKLHYNYWRPITAIRNGDADGNEATQHDPAWVPLLFTPNFAEYPCGHCIVAAAQTEVLKLVGGMPEGAGIRVASLGNPNLVLQSVSSWDELVRQVSDSRMYGGVHYRFSNEAGEEMGRRAARLVVEKLLRPLSADPRR